MIILNSFQVLLIKWLIIPLLRRKARNNMQMGRNRQFKDRQRKKNKKVKSIYQEKVNLYYLITNNILCEQTQQIQIKRRVFRQKNKKTTKILVQIDIYLMDIQLIKNISSMNIKLILAVFALAMLSANAMRLTTHEGQYAWFTFNEGPTGNKCSNANQCDGQRTCSKSGRCQGTSRPAKNENYVYDEGITGHQCPFKANQPNYPNRHYYCDGKRTCSITGWCQGTSR